MKRRLTFKEICGTKEYQLLMDLMERLRANLPLPYFQNEPIQMSDIRGNIGIYIGYQLRYFSKICPIDVKIAFLCLVSTGVWVFDGVSYDFDLPTVIDAYHAWNSVKKALKKKQSIYIKKVDQCLCTICTERIQFISPENVFLTNSFYTEADQNHTRYLYVREKDLDKVGTLFTARFGNSVETTYMMVKPIEFYMRDELIDDEGLVHYMIGHWAGSGMTIEYEGVTVDMLSFANTEYYDIVGRLLERYVEIV